MFPRTAIHFNGQCYSELEYRQSIWENKMSKISFIIYLISGHADKFAFPGFRLWKQMQSVLTIGFSFFIKRVCDTGQCVL